MPSVPNHSSSCPSTSLKLLTRTWPERAWSERAAQRFVRRFPLLRVCSENEKHRGGSRQCARTRGWGYAAWVFCFAWAVVAFGACVRAETDGPGVQVQAECPAQVCAQARVYFIIPVWRGRMFELRVCLNCKRRPICKREFLKCVGLLICGCVEDKAPAVFWPSRLLRTLCTTFPGFLLQ